MGNKTVRNLSKNMTPELEAGPFDPGNGCSLATPLPLSIQHWNKTARHVLKGQGAGNCLEETKARACAQRLLFSE
jgi:hypothetical protein